MEEIVSAEAIRSEILEDARKKSARILEEADEAASSTMREMEAKAIATVEEIMRSSEAHALRFRMETMARLPLETTRMRTEFVDRSLREALGELMLGLRPERVLSLAATMLARAGSFFAGKGVLVGWKGVSEAEVREAARRALPGAASLSFSEDPALPAAGIVAKDSDGSLVMRATMDLVEEWLLDHRRGELAKALCAQALAL